MYLLWMQEAAERSVFTRWPLQTVPMVKSADNSAATAAVAGAGAAGFVPAVGMQSTSSAGAEAPAVSGSFALLDQLQCSASASDLAVFTFATGSAHRARGYHLRPPAEAVAPAPDLPSYKRFIDQLTPPGTILDYQVRMRLRVCWPCS